MPARRALAIARHELKTFLDRPTGYVLLAVFAALVNFFFFRAALISGEASMRSLFSIVPWVFVVFVPAVTMRLMAEEERAGTLELLLAQPVTDLEVIVGKFLGAWSIIALALATTLPTTLGIATGGRLDWGTVFTQYLSALLLGGALGAIGLFASTLTRNQVTASIAAAAISFVVLILGFELVTLAVPRSVAEVLTAMSLLSHHETMNRGVIDLRDLLYFLSVGFAFGLGAYVVMTAKHANRRSERFYNLEVGAILIVGILVALNMLVALVGLRLDLTGNRLFTLSPASVRLVRNAPDDITVTLYASRDLPAQVALTYRDVRDVLRDYAAASRGRVRLVERFPDVDKAAASAAEALGVQPVQFNVLNQDRFSVSQGWLGIALQSGAKREVIPFVQRTDDLEYQLSSLVLKLAGGAGRPTVAFTSGHNERTAADYAAVRKELEKAYTITDVAGGKGGLKLNGVRVAVVAGPQTPFPKADRDSLAAFLDKGGKALFLLEGYTINTQFLMATPNNDGLDALTSRFGARVERKLLFDLASNEAVSFSGGQMSYTVPYPFWPRLKAVAPTVLGDIDTAVLPWASPVSVTTTAAPRGTVTTPLLITSDKAGVESGQPQIGPDRQFAVDERQLKRYEGGMSSQGPGKTPWRVVVIGDAEFPMDRYVQNAPENGVLFLNAIDWLAQDEALAGIRVKTAQPRQLRFRSAVQQLAVTWGNQLGVPLIIAGIGVWHLWRRRLRARRGDAR